LPGCNVILYASPGKEDFYRKLGLRRMKTGMARFQNPGAMARRTSRSNIPGRALRWVQLPFSRSAVE
jgi:hypothetical protein